MSERYTVRDVRMRFEALAKNAKGLGIDVSGWRLIEKGSMEAPSTYRLYDNGRGVFHLSQGFLGTTAREATRTLEIMNGVLWALREAGKL